MKGDVMKFRRTVAAAVCAAVMPLSVSCFQEQQEKPVLPIVEKALADSGSVWFLDSGRISSLDDVSKLPVGMFCADPDCFAVIEKFLSADYFDNITGAEVPDGLPDFAGETFTCLLDYADGPYGDYVRDSSRVQLLRTVAVQNALMLLGKDYYIIGTDELATGIKEPVKVLLSLSDEVGECGFGDIEDILAADGLQVCALSLIHSGVDAAVGKMSSGKDCAVGVMSSTGIAESGVYERIIREMAEETGIRNSVIQIFHQDCRGLAEAVRGQDGYVCASPSAMPDSVYKGPVIGEGEGDIDLNMMDRYSFCTDGNALSCRHHKGKYSSIHLNSPGNYARFHLVSLIEKHRRSGSRVPMETVILGDKCYPFLIDTLKAVVRELYDYKRDGEYPYRTSISPELEFIDPTECLVRNCYRLLRKDGNLALNTGKSELSTFITIPSPSLPVRCLDSTGTVFTDGYKFSRSIDSETLTVKMVPFAPRYLDAETFFTMEALFPESVKLIKKKLY